MLFVAYHVHALKAETTGFILLLGDAGEVAGAPRRSSIESEFCEMQKI